MANRTGDVTGELAYYYLTIQTGLRQARLAVVLCAPIIHSVQIRLIRLNHQAF